MDGQSIREIGPRLPYHDVMCSFTGFAAQDVATHFIQRYNHPNVSTIYQSAIYHIHYPMRMRKG